MGMDINVRLGGRGGRNSRTSKLSGKESHKTNKQYAKTPSEGNTPNPLKQGWRALSGIVGGNVGRVMDLMPMGITMYSAIKSAEKLGLLATSIYQARSGEDMLVNMTNAKIKTVTSLGTNLISGTIRNELFVKPRIMRENYMLDYKKDLYNQQGFNDKNKLS